MLRGLALTALLCLLVGVSTAQSDGVNLNSNWLYSPSGYLELDAVKSTSMETVDVPHTWNQWDVMDMTPGYRRDASWYVKSFNYSATADERVFVHFEAVNTQAQVYVNGALAGTHIGGYVGFEVEITDLINQGENELAVRASNEYEPTIIPSQKADFFIYGGICRDVWLVTRPQTYVSNVSVFTPSVTEDQAELQVHYEIKGVEAEDLEIEVSLTGPDGVSVPLETFANVDMGRNKSSTLSVPNPSLWAPDSPTLYSVKVILKNKGEEIHAEEVQIGFRWFDFEPNGAFLLNGKPLKIRGTHRHEEHAGLGNALPNSLHRKDIEMIKEMGANFVRLAHYPQDPEVYKACNELGLIVWDELPWCRGGVGNDEWKQTTLSLLEEQITQNINHPSIMFWSLGNEVYWLPDFEGGGDTDEISEFLRELNTKSHSLDPGRFTAIRKYYEGADIVDVFSPSIWSGWYTGLFVNYENTLEENRPKYPRFLHMEYGGSSHVGRHTETPIANIEGLNEANWEEVANQSHIESIAKSGDWTENYMVDLFDWYLHVSESLPWFAGNAQWAFKDFGTPLRPENSIPYVNQKGLLDRAGRPKDSYFVFKSYWSEDPFVYIESHTWDIRTGTAGQSKELCVFSNLGEVELFLNDKSMGVKQRDMEKYPAMGLTWNVPFAVGHNTVIARGLDGNGEAYTDTVQFEYVVTHAGKPSEIVLSSQEMTNGNMMITALMVDAGGNRVYDYEGRVYFTSEGAGTLLVNYGTPDRSQVIEFANGRAQIEFVPGEGKSMIEARNQDFKGSYIVLEPQQQR